MSNINYIKELNVIGCSQPDIYVTVTTGFQAAAPALLSLFTPGCTDIVKMKLGLSVWHSKGIRGLIKGAAPPLALEANKFLYKIGYFTAEAGLYWFMVAGIATEFVTTWQSLVFAAEQCQLPDAGTAYGYMAPFVYGPDSGEFLTPAALHSVPGMAVGLHNIAIFPGFQGTVAWTTEWDSWPTRGQAVDVTTWMTEDESEVPINFMRTNVPPSAPKNLTGAHASFDTLHNFTMKQYWFHVHNVGSVHAQCVKGSYTVNLTGHKQPVLPWGCKLKKTTVPSI